MAALQLDSHKTALVLIDLQNAIVGMSIAPHPATQVVANSAKLAEVFRGQAPQLFMSASTSTISLSFLSTSQSIWGMHRYPALFRRLPLLPDFSPATSCSRNVTGAPLPEPTLSSSLGRVVSIRSSSPESPPMRR
jgi:hypothetical protein